MHWQHGAKRLSLVVMIVVFGSMNVDLVMPVTHFPKQGETVLCATDYLSRTGGKGANQAVAAARSGGKVAMVGKVGDDSFGRRCINNLKSQSVWTAGIGISERPTGCATIAVDSKGANFVMVAPGANLDVTADQAPDEVLNNKHVVLTQLEVTPEATFNVLARARKNGATTILNASPAHSLPRGVLKDVDYLIVNELEAQQLAHSLGIEGNDPRLLARGLAALGPLTCIITLEAHGCVAARGNDIFAQETLQVEVVDTTGAGDAFCGIFASCLLKGMPWIEALHRASAGASLSCLGLGAQAGIPFSDDIDAAAAKLPLAKKIS